MRAGLCMQHALCLDPVRLQLTPSLQQHTNPTCSCPRLLAWSYSALDRAAAARWCPSAVSSAERSPFRTAYISWKAFGYRAVRDRNICPLMFH